MTRNNCQLFKLSLFITNIFLTRVFERYNKNCRPVIIYKTKQKMPHEIGTCCVIK